MNGVCRLQQVLSHLLHGGDDDQLGVLWSDGLWSEEIASFDDALHVTEYLFAVIDEIGDTEPLYDRRFVSALSTEVEVVRIETSELVEVVAIEPPSCLVFDDESTLGHDEDVLGAVSLDQVLDQNERAFDRRRFHEVVSTKIGVSAVVVDTVGDDATDIDTDTFRHSSPPFGCWAEA